MSLKDSDKVGAGGGGKKRKQDYRQGLLFKKLNLDIFWLRGTTEILRSFMPIFSVVI